MAGNFWCEECKKDVGPYDGCEHYPDDYQIITMVNDISNDAELGRHIRALFKSGNAVPVTRIILTRESVAEFF